VISFGSDAIGTAIVVPIAGGVIADFYPDEVSGEEAH
jgi:hypothetical protein